MKRICKSGLRGGIALLSALLLLSAGTVPGPATAEGAPAEEPAGRVNAEAAAGELAQNNYQKICENAKLELYTDLDGERVGTFAVRNKEDGEIWYSNPPDASDDEIAVAVTEMQSLLTVTCYDEQADSVATLNSRYDSVLQNAMTLKGLGNGLRFLFEFPSVKVKVPLDVLLNDDGSLSVRVDTSKIEEKGASKVFSVGLLPYFCVGSAKDEGFVLVPDGSGAVMKLNNGKQAYGRYEKKMYGGDQSDAPYAVSVKEQPSLMPVFGLCRNGSAVFSVITQGAAQSSVYAITSGVESTYNAVWNDVTLRKVISYTQSLGWQGNKTIAVYQETAFTLPAIENTYYFASGEDASLRGMAQIYRTYLQKEGWKPAGSAKPSVYVNVLGALTKKKPVMGFPMEQKQIITTYSQTAALLERLAEAGVDGLQLRYLEWDARSVAGRIVNKAAPLSALGGKAGFQELIAYAKEKGIGLYPDVELTTFQKPSYLFQQYFSAARNLNNEVGRLYSYKPNLYVRDENKPAYYFLRYTALEKSAEAFFASYDKLKIPGISLGETGRLVVGDYSDDKQVIEPWKGAQAYAGLAASAKERTGSLLLSSPNMYAAVYADHIVDVPESSRYDMLDETVPFYQLVMAGSVSYAGTPINLQADVRSAFLRALATGSGLQYSLAADGIGEKIKNTDYDGWIGCDPDKWLTVIAEQAAEMRRVYVSLGSSRLVEYATLDGGVTRSTFEGGAQLLVNTGETDRQIDGQTVKAGQYLVLQGGASVD